MGYVNKHLFTGNVENDRLLPAHLALGIVTLSTYFNERIDN